MFYGASYYHEYLPYERLREDVAHMRAMGLNYQRVGDSIWALSEPRPGVIELDWLAPVLDALHEGGIRVLLATPTYAIPPWLARDHPEVMAVGPDGNPLRYGGRQNADFSHPTYREHAERIIRAFLERYAQHPSVIGVQLDNEIGVNALHNDHVVADFVDSLRKQYGDVDALNDAWGLNYWSHRLHDWDELWTPGTVDSGNTNPSYDLAWRRFQSSLSADFLAWQARIAREYLRDDQFVTHDLVGGHGRPYVSRREVHEILDLPAENFPVQMQDGLRHPAVPFPPSYHDGSGQYGAMQLFLRGDLARSPRHRNFFVTELNPISVGGSAHNYPAWDGQWRLAAYTAISRGAVGVAYWHWHTNHTGHETYSGGILGHDFDDNRCSRELATIAHELREHDALLTGLEPEAEVALLYSDDSRYACEFQPPLEKPGTFDPDPHSYQRIVDTFYRGFFDAGAQLATVRGGDDLTGYPVVVAPALVAADDATLEQLDRYARDGGHLVLSFRSGYADEQARARTVRAPGPLREAAGVGYSLYTNLTGPVPVHGTGGLDVAAGAEANGWVDELELEGAVELARYDHPHLGAFPAVTTHEYGRGRVTYVGTLPDATFGRALADHVLTETGVRTARSELVGTAAALPESVRVTRAASRDGRRLWFVTKWSNDAAEIALDPALALDTVVGPLVEDGTVRLGGWDLTVLVEEVRA